MTMIKSQTFCYIGIKKPLSFAAMMTYKAPINSLLSIGPVTEYGVTRNALTIRHM